MDDKRPRIIGHRGAGGEAPENTLPSFQKALNDGATVVELDVHGTKEGEVVVIHDPTLERTTNGRGQVRKHKFEELRELDAGYWFTKGEGSHYPFRGQNIKIPTLEQFLTTFPEAKAIIEIKQARPSIVRKVTGTIRKLSRENSVLLATEDDRIMKEIRAELRKNGMVVASGFSYGEVAAFMNCVTAGKESAYVPPGQALQIPREYAGIKLVSEQTLRAAHELGVEMFVWTVNETAEMSELLELEVDGIITDYPARLRGLLSRESH